MKIYKTSQCYNVSLDLWQYDCYRQNTLVSSKEQLLLLELIRERRPKKILEVGVHAGGTSALILHCIDQLNLDADLYSVDLSNQTDPDIGFLVKELASKIPLCLDKWNLYTGCTVARVIEEIGQDIDMLVLDAAHILPGEVLDFLTVFPFLSKHAVVVSHDILAATPGISVDWNATGILFSSVVAEKYMLMRDDPADNSGSYCNIAAFQITEDSRKYIENLIVALHLPWLSVPLTEHMEEYMRVIKAHYSSDEFEHIMHFYYAALYHKNSKKAPFMYDKLFKLRGCSKNTIAIWGATPQAFSMWSDMWGIVWSTTAKEGPTPFCEQLFGLYQSLYFIDNNAEVLKTKEYYQYLPFSEKDDLVNDQNLSAVIVAPMRIQSRIEILNELSKMNIPDHKIHFVEEFIES